MMTTDEKKELMRFGVNIRMEIVRTIASLGVGHLGGSLSISDLLAVLYGKEMKYDPSDPHWDGRDWLVLSKGHAGPALYSALALKGYFSKEELLTLNKPHTRLPSHCDRNLTPGVDMTTGSLGQGASTACGIALGHKMDGKPNYTYLILGDGESEEGQVWEAALFAAQRKLDHLIAFLDFNRLQLDGPVDEICSLGDPAEKFRSFGWYAQTVNGHDVEAIADAIEKAKASSGKPCMIVLNTIKGYGWSGSEGKVSSHSMNVSAEQLADALAEMSQALAAI